jgi:hypothetical protein
MSSVLKRRRQIATTFMKTRTRAQIKSMGGEDEDFTGVGEEDNDVNENDGVKEDSGEKKDIRQEDKENEVSEDDPKYEEVTTHLEGCSGNHPEWPQERLGQVWQEKSLCQ